MIDFEEFNDGGIIRYNDADPDSLLNEIDRLNRLLYETARRYNRTWKELETFKESHGFYAKPLQFLRFPREIREQIYLYALRAPAGAEARRRWTVFDALGYYPFKPPAPGLLLANKQVYEEAMKVLYSGNVFQFSSTREMMEFEDMIGASNRDLVRRIQITALFAPDNPDRPALSDENDDESSDRWVSALLRSRLEKVVQMTVQADLMGGMESQTAHMPVALRNSIENMFNRKQDKTSTPRLTLRGYGWKDHEMFPADWDIETRQWSDEESVTEEEEEGLANLAEPSDLAYLHLEDFDDESEGFDEDGGYFSTGSENSV